MATIEPMTLQTLQDSIHVLYENDPNTPATSDDEWSIRTTLIKRAIANWESENINWNELYKTGTLATLVTAGQYSYATGFSDMIFPASYVRIIAPSGATQRIEVVKPEEADKYVKSQLRRAYFTGSLATGFTVNFTIPFPTDDLNIGGTIQFDYYKSAASPASNSDTTFIPEMSNPDYIIYWVAAQKHLMDSNNNQYTVFQNIADNTMQNMRIANETMPMNSTTQPDDVEYIRDGSYFGG